MLSENGYDRDRLHEENIRPVPAKNRVNFFKEQQHDTRIQILPGFFSKMYNILSSDFRKFDGSLKMVVATTTEKRKELIEHLQNLKQAKGIRFGYHISDRALLTCVLHTGSTREVHFLDGADGGYAMAAKMLKTG